MFLTNVFVSRTFNKSNHNDSRLIKGFFVNCLLLFYLITPFWYFSLFFKRLIKWLNFPTFILYCMFLGIPPVTHLIMESVHSTAVALGWNHGERPSSKHECHYQVSYHSDESDLKSVTTKNLNCLIKGLKLMTEYVITVTAIIIKDGEMSEPASTSYKTGDIYPSYCNIVPNELTLQSTCAISYAHPPIHYGLVSVYFELL